MILNTILWVFQILLGIKFISVTYTHGLRQTRPTMQQAIQRMGEFSQPLLYVTAICTFIGGVGLILPGALGIATWLTPLTAVFLAIITLLSIILHILGREKPNIIAGVILCTLAAFVAYGRWVLVPL